MQASKAWLLPPLADGALIASMCAEWVKGEEARVSGPHRQGHNGGPTLLGYRLLLQASQEQIQQVSDVTAGLSKYQLPPHLCSVAMEEGG